MRRNKSRDATAAARGITETEEHAIEEVGADLTDFEVSHSSGNCSKQQLISEQNPHFRYVY